MDSHNKTKQIFKILIGTAWLDGIVQPEERVYLQTMAETQKLADDPEIKSLLSGLKIVNAMECYQLLETYLGENPNAEDYQQLIDAISTLIYSDGDIDTQEAKLLTHLQELDPSKERKSAFDKVLKTIQSLYRKAISQ